MFEVDRIYCSDITGLGVRPFPDLVFEVDRILHMLILIPFRERMSVNSREVNWLPWSVLNISGIPYRAIASSSASIQKELSSVFDNLHDSTFLLA